MAKDRQKREKDVQGAKPLTWYATIKDRHTVDDIVLAEVEKGDGRRLYATDVLTLAVRAFSVLYRSDPEKALSLARQAAGAK